MFRMNMPLSNLLKTKKPALLSGAMGTELERRGVAIELPLWSAASLDTSPDTVSQIHKDYIEAGADIIVTNTFRTNRRVFHAANIPDRSAELTAKAVDIARRARDEYRERKILIAGCVAPVEDCYKPDLVPSLQELHDEHGEMVERLAKFGVDFLLVETMTTIREAYAACAAAKAAGKEVIVSFTCRKDGTLYSGEQLSDAIRTVAELQPTLFSLNCISPRYLTPLIHRLGSQITNHKPSTPFAVYGNIGKPDVREGMLVRDLDEHEYAHFALEWKDLGASIIGGCCGTTPAYIKKLSEVL